MVKVLAVKLVLLEAKYFLVNSFSSNTEALARIDGELGVSLQQLEQDGNQSLIWLQVQLKLAIVKVALLKKLLIS